MAQQSVAAELFYDGAWQSVAVGTELNEVAGITISRGADEYGKLTPAKIEWTFEDRADKYRPSNPASPLYGKVNRATPTRITVGGAVRAVCEAASYKPGQTLDFSVTPARGRRWVQYRAEGVLRRIGLWTTPLRSAMFRQISTSYAATLIGYWPGEDGRDATQLSNFAPGGEPGRFSGITLADTDRPAGGDTSIKIGAASVDTRMSGRFKPASTSAGWQFSWAAKLAALPAAGLRQMISWTTTNGYQWAINLDSGVFNLKVVNRSGTALLDNNYTYGAGADPNQWLTYRVKVSQSVGIVTVEFAWYAQGGSFLYGVSPTFFGSMGALSSWSLNGNTSMVDARVAHVFGVTGVTDNLQSFSAIRSFDGYVGETAGARFQRLCDQEGIARTVVGSTADTMPMGRQAAATFLELLKEIAATDNGLIYDTPTAVGLTMRTRRNLYGQTPALTLAWPLEVAPPLEEEFDDTIVNLFTVKQRDGGEAVAEQTTGPLSTAPPPAGVGEYKGGPAVDVNVADETDLTQLAGWGLAAGTIPGARYPQVAVDLDRWPALAAAVHGVELGDRIVITGREPEPIGLVAVGMKEQVNSHRRMVTFTCVPDDVLAGLGVYDSSRYDSASSTLTGAQNTSSVSWSITTQDLRDCWGGAWDGTPMPYDAMVAGERVRVTVCTAPAGAGPYTQTWTVTRSVNGVIKSQVAGEVVGIADPARYGL